MPVNQVANTGPESFYLPAQQGTGANKHVDSFYGRTQSWPCLFPLIYRTRYFTGAQQEEAWSSFIVDENISATPWHSNSQGSAAWVTDSGEGGRRIAQMWDWNGESEVIRPVWNSKDTSHTYWMKISPFVFKASSSPSQWLEWQLRLEDQRLHRVRRDTECLNTQGDRCGSDALSNKQIKPIPTATENTGKQATKLTWKSVECVPHREWVIWTFSGSPHIQHPLCSNSCFKTMRQTFESLHEHLGAC